jgi:hypothetical protein
MSIVTVEDHRITCLVGGCGHKSHSLLGHLEAAHAMSAEDYLKANPGAALLSKPALEEARKRKAGVKRVPASLPASLTVSLMGFEVPVNTGVQEDNCLPMPEAYAFPSKDGKTKEVYKRVLMALIRRRNVFFWGMPGTGKDAIFHAFSNLTRTPVCMVSFKPGTDLSPWFYCRSISGTGTDWEYGHLWEALTKGMLCRDGIRRAPLVVLSDVDRADEAQAEWFRILTDSISGRILDPHGKMVPLFRDSEGNSVVFACSANSCGTGDSRGRMGSAKPIDASIFDRLGRKIEAEYLDWEDEGAVLKRKFPKVAQRAPKVFDQLGKAVASVRSAIQKQAIFAELTHRGLCDIMAEADDVLHFNPNQVPVNLLQLAICAWLDGLEADTKMAAKRLIDPHIAGGAV